MEPAPIPPAPRPRSDDLRARAACVRGLFTSGGYELADGRRVDLQAALAASCAATRLIRPADWPALEAAVAARAVVQATPCPVAMTGETTIAALRRLVVAEARPRVAALNFASARNPGGGWENGAVAQEESIARVSGLVATLERCPDYYRVNRAQPSLLYTDHAIWSPAVPVFADDAGAWEAVPFASDIITMPAPNAGAMTGEDDLRGVLPTMRARIAKVLALAAAMDCAHLVLGAWGCGAFGNQPDLVAGLFAETLDPARTSWRRRFASITFAVYDTTRRRAAFTAFSDRFASPP